MGAIKQIKLFVAHYRWWFEDIGWPWLLTRIVLLMVGAFALSIPPSEMMPERGWYYSPHRVIDMWGRWDSGWYMSIIEKGYTAEQNIYEQANTAFAPLYPYLVRVLHGLLIPEGLQTRGSILFVSVVISNLAFLGFLTIFCQLIRQNWREQSLAGRAAFYLCIFPTSFVFSSFYTESLYMFLAVLAFYAAEKNTWWLAGLSAALSALTRPNGALILIPLAILYWKHRKALHWDLLWLALIPAALLLLAGLLYGTTGDPLEFFNSHDGWDQRLAWPWKAFLAEEGTYIRYIDQTAILLFTVLSFFAFRLGIAYGLWSLFNTLLILIVKGSTVSIVRYVPLAFPAFVVMGLWAERHPWLHQLLSVVFTVLLALMMALWSQFYWVV